jgi:hypothetical protein
MESGDEKGLTKNVKELLKATNEEDACKLLSVALFNYYTSYRADSATKYLELIIKQSRYLAMLNFPENFLFRVALVRGSMELYECYIDEAILPFLKGKNKDKAIDCYAELYSISDHLNEAFFPKYDRFVKGIAFNGAFAQSREITEAVLINGDDYEIMNEVVEKCNTILGRRDILKDLEKRMAMQ